MKTIAAISAALLLLAGCGPTEEPVDLDVFEQSMDAMMRDMSEPERSEFCQASADEGRDFTVSALRSGWESSTDEPFHDNIAAEVVWDWCDEIEAESPAAW